MIADTGVKGATKEAIMAVRELLATDPQTTQQRLAHLGKLTERARTILSRDDPNELGRVLNLAQDELTELNVSDTTLDPSCAAKWSFRCQTDWRRTRRLHVCTCQNCPGCSQAGRNLKTAWCG